MKREFNQLFKIAQQYQVELDKLGGISKPHDTGELELVIRDDGLYKSVSKIYYDGHHALAVEKAYKYIIKLVKQRSGCSNLDGSGLMKKVFSSNNPILKINSMTTQSELDEQLGYMEIFSGVTTGIRNPRAHEPDWEDTNSRALELLSLANHLVEIVRNSTKVDS